MAGISQYEKEEVREVAIALLKTGDIDATDRKRTTALLMVVSYDIPDSAKALVYIGADVSKANSSGTTPLHAAARNGNAELVGILITIGADVNALDWEGQTPLHAAAGRGHTECVSALLDAGADRTIVSRGCCGGDGYTPGDLARLMERHATADLLHCPRPQKQ